MKKTKLIIAMIFGLLTMSTVTNAQNGRLSLGLELGIPMGDFGDATSLGIGGSLRYEYPVSDNIGLMATAGYMTFAGKTVGGVDLGSYGMIPVQIGGKYYFTDNQDGLYLGLEFGIHSLSYTTPDFEFLGVTIDGETVTSTKFSYAPEIGYHLANIDLGLRYQMIATEGSSTSYLGLRAAYVFGEK